MSQGLCRYMVTNMDMIGFLMELNDICHCHVGNIYTEVNTINKYSLKDKLTEIRE